jgi:hypothetical protein
MDRARWQQLPEDQIKDATMHFSSPEFLHRFGSDDDPVAEAAQAEPTRNTVALRRAPDADSPLLSSRNLDVRTIGPALEEEWNP